MNADDDRVQTSTSVQDAERVLRELLEGTFISALQYAAGFRIEFARQGKPPAPLIPMVVWLTFRSDWRVGSPSEWSDLVSRPPWPPPKGEEHDPMRAYALAWLGGAEVRGVRVSQDGGHHIATSCGKDIVLEGTDDIFEESWIIDVPRDVPNGEYWSVSCDNRGSLYARFPRPE
ncbi:MAG: hypothetical protein JRH11_01335 [Deltaproteobacteria bacterium]|nr:hypothetical protein [Deltaproteobacteria bacterium]